MGNKLSSKRKSNTQPPVSSGASATVSSAPSKQESEDNTHHTTSTNSNSARRIHQVADSPYWFPNDEEEMDRLIGQHFAVKSFFGGNIVEKGIPLIPTPLNDGATILDCACGSGAWIMDVATEYPEAKCYGVDMCDVFPKEIRPTNVEFQVANVMQGLPFPDNTFDLVYVRLLLIGLSKEQWPDLWREVKRILKPNGCIQWVEAGMLVKGNEFVNRAGKAFIDMMEQRNQLPFLSQQLDKIVADVGYNVIHYELKDIFLSNQDPLTREFNHDICCIFKGAEPILSKALNVPSEEWPAFVKKLCLEMQKQPDAMWSFAVCFAQKV